VTPQDVRLVIALLETNESTRTGLGIIGSIAVFVLGLGLYFTELFIPSGGVIFVGATLCVGYAIWQLFNIEPWAGYACLAVTAAYLFVLIRWGIRRLSFSGDLGSETSTGSDVQEATSLVGKVGRAETALRPAGVARIGDSTYDVVSSGEFFEAQDRIVVAEVSGNRIVVRAADETAELDAH